MYPLIAKMKRYGCLFSEEVDENGITVEANPDGSLGVNCQSSSYPASEHLPCFLLE